MSNSSNRLLLIGFYGQPNTNKRRESWELMAALKPDDQTSWSVVGDFNEIVTNDLKKGVGLDHNSQ